MALHKNVLPDGLKYLRFGHTYNEIVEKDIFPSTLTHLIFGYKYNQVLFKNSLPHGLKHLVFGRHFNREIGENILPITLTQLTFGYNFNKKKKEKILPCSLTHLTFGEHYNQEINENVLPSSLTYLSFHCCKNFNHQFKINVLPNSLTHFFPSYYKGTFTNLPDSITHLCLWNYEKDISFPNCLSTLYVQGNSEVSILPNTIECIIFYCLSIVVDNLPSSVTKIKLIKFNKENIKLIKKIPYGCKIVDKYDNYIDLNGNLF